MVYHLQKWPLDDLKILWKWPKTWYKTAQEHLLFKLPTVSLKKSRSSCIFLSDLWEISLIQNSYPLGKESWAKIRPSGSESVQMPGVARGMVRLWTDWYVILSLETILNESLFKIPWLWMQLTLLVTRWITQICLTFLYKCDIMNLLK